jgi:hypothetical protein
VEVLLEVDDPARVLAAAQVLLNAGEVTATISSPYRLFCNCIEFLQIWSRTGIHSFYQGCGPGSGLDPDSVTLWIRIRIGNPDPDTGARK